MSKSKLIRANIIVILLVSSIIHCSFVGCEKEVAEVFPSRVFYVSIDGDDNNPGTYVLPWATWNKAFIAAEAGDIVYIRGGVYSYPDYQFGIYVEGKSGNEGSPIQIMNYPGESPVLDFGKNETHGYQYGLALRNCSYWHIKGLSIMNLAQPDDGCQAVLAISCDQIIYENVSSHHHGGSGFVARGENRHITYISCDSYENYDPKSTRPGNGADGFGGVSSLRDGEIQYIGCRAWRNSDDGYDNWDNEGSVVYDSCWSFSNGYDDGDGSGFKFGRTLEEPLNKVQRLVKNCIAFNNKHVGFDQNAGNVRIALLNNISYNNFYRDYAIGSGSVEVIARNNISYSTRADVVPDSFADYVKSENNSWNLNYEITDTDFESTDSVGISLPRLPSGKLRDSDFLRLAPGSLLIDAGVDVGYPYLGDAPDLGPFEKK